MEQDRKRGSFQSTQALDRQMEGTYLYIKRDQITALQKLELRVCWKGGIFKLITSPLNAIGSSWLLPLTKHIKKQASPEWHYSFVNMCCCKKKNKKKIDGFALSTWRPNTHRKGNVIVPVIWPPAKRSGRLSEPIKYWMKKKKR